METAATALLPCAFCRGHGFAPYGVPEHQPHCEVCQGQGTNRVPWPHMGCAFCEGSGNFQSFSCLVCRGTGVVPPLPGPTRRCEECHGRAFDRRCGLPCLRCRGRGIVTAQTPRRGAAGPFLDATHAEADAPPLSPAVQIANCR
jgi:DnaJ-class molecular chaperone